MQIPLELGKFQMCACPTCDRDAVRQRIATSPGGQKYYLGVCLIESHYTDLDETVRELEAGITTKELQAKGLVDTASIFIQQVGSESKHRVAFIAPPQRSQPLPVSKVKPDVTPAANWSWEARPDRWMRLNGASVRLSALSDTELVSACLTIRKANFTRVTSKLSWIKELVSPRETVPYPLDKMEVGTHEAAWKLEEFKQEAEERGLL